MENRPYETDDAMGVGDRPFCSQCEGIELRRQGRFGFWQRSVLARLGLFPWECGLCRKIYMLRRRSALYPSGENSQAQGPHAAAAREAQMQA
jgi:hypothetical protein